MPLYVHPSVHPNRTGASITRRTPRGGHSRGANSAPRVANSAPRVAVGRRLPPEARCLQPSSKTSNLSLCAYMFPVQRTSQRQHRPTPPPTAHMDMEVETPSVCPPPPPTPAFHTTSPRSHKARKWLLFVELVSRSCRVEKRSVEAGLEAGWRCRRGLTRIPHHSDRHTQCRESRGSQEKKKKEKAVLHIHVRPRKSTQLDSN